MISNHTDMYDNYCADCYDIHPIQSQYTKVAAVGRHHKRGAAAFGRGTSFVVSFVLALNRVNVVEMTFGVDGPKIRLTRVDHVPCHYDFMFPRRSYHARLRARGVRVALPPGRGVWGSLRHPRAAGGFGGPQARQWMEILNQK